MIPDFVITGPQYRARGPAGYLCAGFWDSRWDFRPELVSCPQCLWSLMFGRMCCRELICCSLWLSSANFWSFVCTSVIPQLLLTIPTVVFLGASNRIEAFTLSLLTLNRFDLLAVVYFDLSCSSVLSSVSLVFCLASPVTRFLSRHNTMQSAFGISLVHWASRCIA